MPRKKAPDKTGLTTPREAADYTSAILANLEKLARANSQILLAHLLDMARKEADWLAKR